MVTYRSVLLIGLLVWTSSMPGLVEIEEPLRYLLLFFATGLTVAATCLWLVLAVRNEPRCTETPARVERLLRTSRLWRLGSRLEWPSVPFFALLNLLLGARVNAADTTLWETIGYCLTTFGPCTFWLLCKELSEAWLLRDLATTGVSRQRTMLREVRERLKAGSFSGWIQLLLPICVVQVLFAQSRLLADFAGVVGSSILCFVAGIAMLGFLPSFASWWMGTRAMDRVMQQRIGQLFSRCNARVRAIRLVPGVHWNSAAVVGIVPWGRQLWIGETLLKKLNTEEIDMVALHELAHIRKRHFLFRMMPTAWACLAVWAVNLGFECLPPTSVWTVVTTAINLSIAVGVFGLGMLLVSHASEFEADRIACEMALCHCEWASANPYVPVRRLAAALRKVQGAECASRRSWLHPSLDDRIRNLAAVQVDTRTASV
jgi:Zn-dependent protease with chaperone function